MTCPRCREQHDILRYVPMGQIEEFKDETVPVYKCPSCRWIFAPAQNAREDSMLTFSTATGVAYAEVHFAGTQQREIEDGLVQKDILRTGHWPVIPTAAGLIDKPLTIVRDGKSDKEKGIIALSELVENFRKVGQRVQIPLTDEDKNDHKNKLRLNTGFVTDIFIVDEGNVSKLVAKMQFTEPDVKDKVLRGTYADVSCGIPWELHSRGEQYGAFLEHVCITNRPFIDNLGPFLALSDELHGTEAEVVHFSGGTTLLNYPPDPVVVPKIEYRDPFGGLSLKQVLEQAENAVPESLKENFVVRDVRSNGIVIVNDEQKMSLLVPFVVEEGKLASKKDGWAHLDYEEAAPGVVPVPSQTPPPEPPPAPAAPPQPESSGSPEERELEAARQLRNVRLNGAVAASQNPMKEAHMPLTREELEQLNLSDLPEGQRAVFQKLLDENSTLTLSSREVEANQRVAELEELGFKEKPGALKLYRQVMLGDDGGPAVVVLSDDGKKEGKTALSILDEFIEAIKGAEGKVVLSDQAHLVPGDHKPPTTPEGEKKPFAERVADAKTALTGVNG